MQESALPQKLADHTAAARDQAAAHVSNLRDQVWLVHEAVLLSNSSAMTRADVTDHVILQAQVHQQAAQDIASQKLAEAKMHAQETARIGQEKAAELARNVSTPPALDLSCCILLQHSCALLPSACCSCLILLPCGVHAQVQNASVEDVNRSWVGRAMGAIVLLWLASVAVGIPFKYGLAAALLAVSAVLFLDWDRARRGGGRPLHSGSGTMATPVRRCPHARSECCMHRRYPEYCMHRRVIRAS